MYSLRGLKPLKSRREQILSILRDSILKGKIEPGTPLIETELAKEIGVSTTPIREAIRMLEKEGLVCSIPHKGTAVKMYTDDERREIYEIRGVLESYAGYLAAKKITAEELELMKSLLIKANEHITKKEFDKAAEINAQFHECIWCAARNKHLYQLLISIKNHITLMRYQAFQLKGEPELSWQTHKNIVTALEQKDPRHAEKLLRDHIFHLVEMINNPKD